MHFYLANHLIGHHITIFSDMTQSAFSPFLIHAHSQLVCEALEVYLHISNDVPGSSKQNRVS